MRVNKFICAILTVCLCVGVMVLTVSAEVIHSVSKRTPGGLMGTTNLILTAERTYQPSSSHAASYYYATRAYYSGNTLKADSWELTGVFILPASQERASSVKNNVTGTFISKTKLESQDQYVSGQFTSTAVSSIYGNLTVELNVAY